MKRGTKPHVPVGSRAYAVLAQLEAAGAVIPDATVAEVVTAVCGGANQRQLLNRLKARGLVTCTWTVTEEGRRQMAEADARLDA